MGRKINRVATLNSITQEFSMKVKPGKVEKNIYVELRSGAVRFVVEVSPLPKSSSTFDVSQFDFGLRWARRRRVELLEQKSQSTPVAPPPMPTIASGLSRCIRGYGDQTVWRS